MYNFWRFSNIYDDIRALRFFWGGYHKTVTQQKNIMLLWKKKPKFFISGFPIFEALHMCDFQGKPQKQTRKLYYYILFTDIRYNNAMGF